MILKKGLKAMVANVIAIIASAALLLGSTFAWFTSTDSSNGNVIASGLLNVKAYWMEGNKAPASNEWTTFEDGPVFNYDNWEPGYVSAKHLKIANEGSLAFKYKLLIAPNGAVSALADVIDVYYLTEAKQVTRQDLSLIKPICTLSELISDPDGAAFGVLLPEGATPNSESEAVGSVEVTIALKMKENLSNEYQGLSIGNDFALKIYATQYSYENDTFGNDYDENAEYPPIPDSWDGTASIAWYTENPEATTFTLGSAEDLAGLAALVDGTVALMTDTEISLPVSFEGKTILLDKDVDLYMEDENGEPISFDPIGDKVPFDGTFDGQGHTIANIYESGWAFGYEWGSYGSLGLFGEVKDATVKNVTISGAEIFVEGGDVSAIAGSATGNCTFEDITIKNSKIATYNNGNGGIIGWSGAGSYTFKNITIEEDVVFAGLWGSFDSSIGGVVGQAEPGATYVFENVNVACRLDVYNDVTASYDYYNYRMCGMLIGRLAKTTTIDGNNYPDVSQYNIVCNNVTVTYGDWANYHYCRAEGARGIRVEAGYQYDGIAADYDHSVCTVHHNELIEFDQIFGGDQYGVRGLAAYEGVNVIYNK